MNADQHNATAGPSSQPELFFLPWQLPPTPTTYLQATQDLITRLGLLTAYDKHVRPHAVPVGQTLPDVSGLGQVAPRSPTLSPTKGKGKEREPSAGLGITNMPTPGGSGPDVGDDDGKAEKKRKNTYKHLIKGIPGKHSMKKDDYLVKSVMEGPKPRPPILPFDARTQRDAFSVTLGGVQSWSTSALLADTPQEKEAKKQRKEARKALKTGAPPTPTLGASPGAAGGFAVPPTPSLVVLSGRPSTPRVPGTPRVSGIVHNVPQRPATPRVSAPPTPATTVAYGTPAPSAAPTPTPVLVQHHPLPARPQATSEVSRGKKRTREDSTTATNGHHSPPTSMNGNGYGGGGTVPKKQKVVYA